MMPILVDNLSLFLSHSPVKPSTCLRPSDVGTGTLWSQLFWLMVDVFGSRWQPVLFVSPAAVETM